MILDSLENKKKILAQFLKICLFEGWNDKALEEAMKLCEIDTKFKNLIFENGCFDLIELYIAEKNANLASIIAQTPDFASFKIREKIRFALYKLFENEQENQLALQRLRNFYFDLNNFSTKKHGAKPLFMAFKHVGKISDSIWSAIGDKSTDFNFYTKRLTLSKIILQTFPIFVKDKSLNLQKTKENIDIQIEKVMKFEKIKAKIKNISGDLQKKSCEFFIDEDGGVKNIKKIIKDLPFFRLFN